MNFNLGFTICLKNLFTFIILMFCIWSTSRFVSMVFLCFCVARIGACYLALYNCLPVIVLLYVALSNTNETLRAYETRRYITWNTMKYMTIRRPVPMARVHFMICSWRPEYWKSFLNVLLLLLPITWILPQELADSQAKTNTRNWNSLILEKTTWGKIEEYSPIFKRRQTDSTFRGNKYLKFINKKSKVSFLLQQNLSYA